MKKMKWAFLRRLYVKTPARNYTLFQNIFAVKIFFNSKITQMFTDELLTFLEKIIDSKNQILCIRFEKMYRFWLKMLEKTFFSKILIKYTKNYSNFWLKISGSAKNASVYVIKFSVRNSNEKFGFFGGFLTIFLQFSFDFWQFFEMVMALDIFFSWTYL